MAGDSLCSICGRSFGRAEHRDRHMVTAHDGARPYRCSYCNQPFQRTDALRRHVDKHCSRKQELEHGNSNRSGPKSAARVSAACDLCHDKKVKCDGQRPCKRCRLKSQNCTSVRIQKRYFPDMGAVLSPPNELPTKAGSANDSVATSQASTYLSPSRLSDRESTQPVVTPQDLPVDPEPVGQQGTIEQAAMNIMESMEGNTASTAVGYGESGTGTSDVMSMAMEVQMDSLPPPNSGSWIWFNFLDELEDNSAWMNFLPPTMVEENDERGEALAQFQNLFCSNEKVNLLDDDLLYYLQRPLIPRQYDPELLSILINIFLKHISGVLTSFKNFHITPSTSTEQILAMAAVGELFAKAKGSAHILSPLFTDCSRMVYNWVCSPNHTRENITSHVQALILLSTFGMCAEHKRARETTEAHHHVLIQALYDHHSIMFAGQWTEQEALQHSRLVDDVLMLECYRFVLLQRAPVLTPYTLIHLASPGAEGLDTNRQYILKYLYQVSTFDNGPEALLNITSLQDVAVFSLVSSFAAGHWTELSYEAENRQWPTELFDRSLEQMLHSSSVCKQISAAWLCHMIGATLHAPFDQIRDAAYAKTIGQKPLSTVVETIRNWQLSSSKDIAFEHATRMISLGVHTLSIREPDDSESDTVQYREGPHDGLCVFNAGLVIWACNYSKDKTPGLEQEEQAPNFLTEAIAVLSKMPVRLTTNLTKILMVLDDSHQ